MTDLFSESEIIEIGENGNNVLHSPPQSKVTTPIQLLKYDFVLNNYTEIEVNEIIETLTCYCKKAVFGKEVGESGTPHLQGCFFLKKKERITAIRKWLGFSRASFRAMRNEKACIAYCQKDNCFFSIGFPPKPKPIKIIEKLYKWQTKVEDIFKTVPNERSIHWFHETLGGVGKSAFVKYMVAKHNCLFCDGGKKSDLINLVFNADMDNCKCIIWDLPRVNKGKISYSTIESVKNGLVCNTKFETGVKLFNSPHIFVFSNFPPEEDALSHDRWIIKQIGIKKDDDIDFEVEIPKELIQTSVFDYFSE